MCRDLLGGRVYFEVLRGAQAIEESSADESASASASADSGTGTTPSLVEWAKMKPDVRLPPLTGVLTAPIALRVDSPSLHCVFEGWQTSKQFTYLTQPLQAEMKLSPKMAQ